MTMMKLTQCAQALLEWYSAHYRMLPWRQNEDPYRIWISEIMLQQTRVEAVLRYYDRLIERCPTVFDLAELPEDELLKLWEGLGYYSRARNLQKAARLIVEKYNGQFPADYSKLLELPGVGEYTAGAIASLAFNIAVPAVDGNVMRVLARLTADDTDVLSTGAKRHFASIVTDMMPRSHAGRFNQALMELGETVCLPNGTPNCAQCPWSPWCKAHAEGKVMSLPVRSSKKARRVEQRVVAVVCVVGEEPRVLLHKRAENGLLANLWEFPNCLVNETDKPLPNEIMKHCVFQKELPRSKHVFTHIEWHMHGKFYMMPSGALPENYQAVTIQEAELEYALPRAFRTYAALLPTLLQKEDI